jgi:hypothetical protein
LGVGTTLHKPVSTYAVHITFQSSRTSTSTDKATNQFTPKEFDALAMWIVSQTNLQAVVIHSANLGVIPGTASAANTSLRKQAVEVQPRTEVTICFFVQS